jgi:hypothetical protein
MLRQNILNRSDPSRRLTEFPDRQPERRKQRAAEAAANCGERNRTPVITLVTRETLMVGFPSQQNR